MLNHIIIFVIRKNENEIGTNCDNYDDNISTDLAYQYYLQR